MNNDKYVIPRETVGNDDDYKKVSVNKSNGTGLLKCLIVLLILVIVAVTFFGY